jgi:hypothetical protein
MSSQTGLAMLGVDPQRFMLEFCRLAAVGAFFATLLIGTSCIFTRSTGF